MKKLHASSGEYVGRQPMPINELLNLECFEVWADHDGKQVRVM